MSMSIKKVLALLFALGVLFCCFYAYKFFAADPKEQAAREVAEKYMVRMVGLDYFKSNFRFVKSQEYIPPSIPLPHLQLVYKFLPLSGREKYLIAFDATYLKSFNTSSLQYVIPPCATDTDDNSCLFSVTYDQSLKRAREVFGSDATVRLQGIDGKYYWHVKSVTLSDAACDVPYKIFTIDVKTGKESPIQNTKSPCF